LFASDDSFDFLLFYLIGGKWLFMAKEKAYQELMRAKALMRCSLLGGQIISKFNKSADKGEMV
jgi:hypothetical protein